MVFHQDSQRVKRLRGQRDRLVILKQLLLGRVQPERTEFIRALAFERHKDSKKNIKILSNLLKDQRGSLRKGLLRDRGHLRWTTPLGADYSKVPTATEAAKRRGRGGRSFEICAKCVNRKDRGHLRTARQDWGET